MKKKITIKQAFFAMKNYLDDFYFKTHSDDVGAFLGACNWFEDGGTFDPAMWDDWVKIAKENYGEEFSLVDGFNIMKKFLQNFYDLAPFNDFKKILSTLCLSPDNKPINSDAWSLWLKCIDKALEDEGKPYKSPFV